MKIGTNEQDGRTADAMSLAEHVLASIRGAAAVLGATVGLVQGVLQALAGTHDAVAPRYGGSLEGTGYRNLVSRQQVVAYDLPNAVMHNHLHPAQPSTVGTSHTLATQPGATPLASHKLVDVHAAPIAGEE